MLHAIPAALCLLAICSGTDAAESAGKPYIYKTSSGKERRMEIFFPPGHDPAAVKVPGLILFHGGGWRGGDPGQFRAACTYFASRGLVCATAEYQLPDQAAIRAMPDGQSHKRLCVTDAKSAVRWFKANATELGVDPARIITGGGSAGAHISALATMNPELNDPADPEDIDTSVVAYLWFNPAFHESDKNDPEIDILTHARADLPPAIVFFGDDDRWLSGWNAAHAKWKEFGVRNIDLRIAEGQPHGFFNREPWRTLTLIAADEFLVQHGLIEGKPTLPPPDTGEQLVTTASAESNRPNILFLLVDDLRPELGCYGSPQVISPRIDKLASQGMRFDRGYCQVPVCGASRASLMTGILPTRTRFVNFDSRADEEAHAAATLPQVFRDAGYTTLSHGKVFHVPDDTNERSWSEPAWRAPGNQMQGLDPETMRRLSETRRRGRFYESPDVPDDAYPDGQTAIKAIKTLRRLHESGEPFFLACGFLKPHLPFYAPKRYWALYQHDEILIAANRTRPRNAPRELRGSGEFRSYHLADFDENSDEFHRMMRHGYLACTSYVDKLVGDVLDELDRLGLAENTIVVLWGDHGWHLGEHNFWGKHNTMHLATRVPLIIKVPGKPAGSTEALVETSDIFPTLCALAGIEVPETVQGRSFVELLEHPGRPFRESAYSRFGPGDAVITGRFTYTSYHNGRSEMLYDLSKDPQENTNVAAKPEYADDLGRMRDLLKERQAEAAALRF